MRAKAKAKSTPANHITDDFASIRRAEDPVLLAHPFRAGQALDPVRHEKRSPRRYGSFIFRLCFKTAYSGS
jgi:hypothetical protein